MLAAAEALATPDFQFLEMARSGQASPDGSFVVSGVYVPFLWDGQVGFKVQDTNTLGTAGLYFGAPGNPATVILEDGYFPGRSEPVLAFNHSASGDATGLVYRASVGANNPSGFVTALIHYQNGVSTELVADDTMSITGVPFTPTSVSIKQFTYANNRLIYQGTARAPGGLRYTSVSVLENGVTTRLFSTEDTFGPYDIALQSIFELTPAYEGGRYAYTLVSTKADAVHDIPLMMRVVRSDLQTGLSDLIDTSLIGDDLGSGYLLFNGVLADGDDAYMMAASSQGAHVYRIDGAGLTKVFDIDATLSPEGNGAFTDVSNFAVDNGDIFFSANTVSGGPALYRTFNGGIARVIGAGDTINGETVTGVLLADNGIDGDNVGLMATLTNGTSYSPQGLWYAQVVRGSDQLVPIQHVAGAVNEWWWTPPFDGAWLDAPEGELISLYYQEPEPTLELLGTQSASTGDGIVGLKLPIGYGSSVRVFADGTDLGLYSEDAYIDILALLGAPAQIISLEGLVRPDGAVGAHGIPVSLFYSNPDVGRVVVFVPEPGALVLLCLAAGSMLGRRSRLNAAEF